MLRWIGSRIIAALITLCAAAIIIFSTLRLVPGDPVAAITSGARLTPEQREAVRERLGLNQDFFTAFFGWVADLLRFDFGDSLVYGSSVNDLIGSRVPSTVLLMTMSLVLTLLVGISIALASALKPGLVDRLGLVFTSMSIATPSFVVALILLSVFSVQLRWFPSTGSGDGLGDQIYHMVLPSVTLCLVAFGVVTRVSRAAFREALKSEHVEVSASRGVPMPVIVRKHVVKNALGPIATVTAMMIAALFIGTVIVETVFGIDGVGSLLVQSIVRRDFPVVQAISLISVALFVVTSMLADLVLPIIDPRVRVKVDA